MQQAETDILIAGAGPAGLLLACQLAMHKVNFRIIDKAPSATSYSGAMIIHAGSMEIFSQLGIAEDFTREGTIIRAINMVFGGKKTTRIDISRYGSHLSVFPYALILEQSKTEAILIRFLNSRDHTVDRETELTDFAIHKDHIISFLEKPDKNEMVKSQFLIGADGNQSFVRTRLGIPLIGQTHSRTLFTIDSNLNLDLPHNEVLFSFSKGATTGFFPLSGKKWRVDASMGKINEEVTLDYIRENFSKQTGLKIEIGHEASFSVFHSQQRYSGNFAADRIFLAGDAAHLYSPVGAQGMNHGFYDASNLSWKLAYVVKKWARSCILESYEQERKPVAIKTAAVSDLLFDFLSSGNWIFKVLRIRILPFIMPAFKKQVVRNFLFRKISGTGIYYRKSILNEQRKHLFNKCRPGQRIPFVYFTQEGMDCNLREIIDPGSYHLLIFLKDGELYGLPAVTDKYKHKITPHVFHFDTGTKQLYNLFGIKKSCYFLVRPDMVISARGRDTGRLEIYLDRLLIPDLYEES